MIFGDVSYPCKWGPWECRRSGSSQSFIEQKLVIGYVRIFYDLVIKYDGNIVAINLMSKIIFLFDKILFKKNLVLFIDCNLIIGATSF